MNKKRKVILVVVGILLTLSVAIGISYAYYMFGASQSGYNAIIGDCFEITFADDGELNINGASPIYDSNADELTPYTFYITNVCNYEINYSVSLETLDSTTMSLDAIKVKMDDKSPKLLGSIADNDSSSIINSNVLSSKTIDHGKVEGNSTKTLNLRIWIDVNSTIEQAANKVFNSKVVVNATIGGDAYLATGIKFNAAMKKLAGVEVSETQLNQLENLRENYNNYCLSSEIDEEATMMCNIATKADILNENFYAYIMTEDTNIKQFKVVDEMPVDIDNYEIVSNESSNCDIYLWFDDGIIYLYTDANKIYANDMSFMFFYLKNIGSIDLSIFDTSKTTDMSYLFAYYPALIQAFYTSTLDHLDLSHFDTSNVEDMSFMFAGLTQVRQIDISHFDTSNVTDMTYMFGSMTSLESLDLSNFNTSKVRNMAGLFGQLLSIKSLDLSNFDTSNVTNMRAMFQDMQNLESIDLSNFNTSKVTNMAQMFGDVGKVVELDLSNFDTSNVTDMNAMFQNMHNLQRINLSSFNTSKVRRMFDMFWGDSSLTSLDLSNFDTSLVSDMQDMFASMSALTSLNISNFNTSNVTTFDSMFNNCKKLETLDLSSFDTRNASSFGQMFQNMYSLKTIYATNLFDTSNAERDNAYRYKYLFLQDTLLVGGAGTTYDGNNVDVEYARIDDPDNGKPGYFTLKTN